MSFKIERELKRKALHLPGLLIPWLYQYWPRLIVYGLGILSILYYVSELLRIKYQRPVPLISFFTTHLTRSKQFDFAPLYLALGLIMASVFFPFKAALAGAILVCLGDSVAALVGMKFGHRKILFTQKTYLGTFAFFLTGLLCIGPFLGWPQALLLVGVASLIEVFSVEGIDNLLLPVLGGLIARAFL